MQIDLIKSSLSIILSRKFIEKSPLRFLKKFLKKMINTKLIQNSKTFKAKREKIGIVIK